MSLAGDGVVVKLGDGTEREVKFSLKSMMRLEDAFGSTGEFLRMLEEQPFSGTAASLLLLFDDVKDEDQAVALLDGLDGAGLVTVRAAVQAAFMKANVFAPVDETPDPQPATGVEL